MKKTIAGLLAVLMLQGAVLTGCGELEESEAPIRETEQAGVIYGTGLETGAMASDPAETPERRLYRGPGVGFRPAVTLGGAALGEEHYWYRNTLTPEGRKAYDQLRAGLLRGEPRIDLTVPMDPEEAFRVYQMVIMDGPELFYANNSARCSYNDEEIVLSVCPEYNQLAEDIPGNTRLLQESVAEAVGAMRGLKEPLQQVKYAHDYLLHTVDFREDAPYNQSCFSALVGGESVCAGYAHAFQYLLQQMNIPCAYVVGEAGEAHAWNQVRLYGQVYAVDVTWDDPIGNPPDDYHYDFFNVTDRTLSRSHTRGDLSALLPQSLGTDCSYENAFGGSAPGTDFSGEHLPTVHLPKPTQSSAPSAPPPAPLQKPDHAVWNDDIWNGTQWETEDEDWEEEDWSDEDWDEEDEDFWSDFWEDEDFWDDDEGWEDFWDEDEDWEDFWDDGEDWDEDSFWDDFWEDADEEDLDWWNFLDENWDEDDWDEVDDGCYEIYDEDTDCCYFWCSDDRRFRARDERTGEELILDTASGSWRSAD